MPKYGKYYDIDELVQICRKEIDTYMVTKSINMT